MRTRFSVVRPPTNRPHLMEPLGHRPLLVVGTAAWIALGLFVRRQSCTPAFRAREYRPGREDRQVCGGSPEGGPIRMGLRGADSQSPDPFPPGIFGTSPLGDSPIACVTGRRSGCAPTGREGAPPGAAAPRMDSLCSSTKVLESIVRIRGVAALHAGGVGKPTGRRCAPAPDATSTPPEIAPLVARRSAGPARQALP
jgi:hypothetical protein